jgi:hypothetical protein
MAKGSLSSKVPEKSAIKKPVIEYNNKTYKSYIENGLEVPRNCNKKENIFLARVSDKYPIIRQVKTMIRERILDTETNKMREILTYTEDWFGKNWIGVKLPPVRGHIEGVWRRQNLEPVIDEESHEITAYKEGESDLIYDIDFKDTTVDSILKKSLTPDPELVKYIVKGAGGRRGYATYEQFKDLTWNQCTDILLTNGGFEGAHIKQILQHTK